VPYVYLFGAQQRMYETKIPGINGLRKYWFDLEHDVIDAM